MFREKWEVDVFFLGLSPQERFWVQETWNHPTRRRFFDVAALEREGVIVRSGYRGCRVCGKELRSPDSIQAGVGPVCALRERGEAPNNKPRKGKTHAGKGLIIIDLDQLPLFAGEV